MTRNSLNCKPSFSHAELRPHPGAEGLKPAQFSPCKVLGPAYPLPPLGYRVCGCSLRLRNEKLTNNLAINLRCHRNVWSVRQWSLRWVVAHRTPVMKTN